MLGLLMLLTALLDSSTACPLSLQPPTLMLEVGKEGYVNCTTTVDDHYGIHWTYGNETQPGYLDSFTVLHIPFADRNKTATCTIKVNDTFECSKDLDIKVYKSPSNISVQSNGSPIKGHEIELTCTIFDVGGVQKLTVSWYMNNALVRTGSMSAPNRTMSLTSSLKRNVSREDDGATFTCEASAMGLNGSLFVSNDSWKLSVQYAPEFEEKTYNIQVNNSGEVSLHCEATGNPAPFYKWIKDEVIIANNTNYLNFTVNGTTTFQCQASNNLGSTLKTFIITVMETPAPSEIGPTAAPKSADCPVKISPDTIHVKFGDPVAATCTAATTRSEFDGLGWEATTGGIGPDNVTHLDWSVPKVSWDTAAYCYINLEDGSQCKKELTIIIWKLDEALLSPVDNSSMEEGKPHKLKCEVFNVAPVKNLQVKWYQDGKLLHTDRERFTGSNATLRNETSILDLTPEKQQHKANFTCEAELLLGQDPGQNPKVVSKSYTANVQYKPNILECSKSYADREGDLLLKSVPCKASGNPEPDVHWFYNDQPVNSSIALTRRDSGTYTAKFENIMGSTNATVDIVAEYGPSFSCKDQYNVTENDLVRSECEPEGIPKPNVVWYKDGITIAVPKVWKRQDGGQYSLVAENKYGQTNHTMSINVLYFPRISGESVTIEFDLGENVTLECITDGNPPPVLVWKKSPPAASINSHSRGRHSYAYVTEATSSDAGLYSCTATNDFGSVSKNFTLMMRGKQRTVHNIVFISIALAVLLVIFVLVLVYRNYRKKSGHYDVISDSVPLTTRGSGII